MRKSLGYAIVVAAAVGAFAASSHAAESLQLDARGPDVSSAPLQSGAVYYVRVSGTASIWPRSQWNLNGTVCGAAEAGPMYPSSGTDNGPVGFDAETIFGVPPGVPFRDFRCVPSDIPLHVTQQTPGGFQLGIGGSFSHTEPLGGPYSVPQANHTYLYRVAGTGAPVSFRFDDGPVSDNYGVFRISVLTDAECQAEHCTGSTPNSPAPPSSNRNPAPAATKNALGVLTVSTQHRCSSRRLIRLRLKAPKGVALRSAVVRYRNRTIRLRGRKLKTAIDLRGLPKGTFKVRITMTTTRGQTLKVTRRFKTCVTRKHQ
jgi:hypothetical protein